MGIAESQELHSDSSWGRLSSCVLRKDKVHGGASTVQGKQSGMLAEELSREVREQPEMLLSSCSTSLQQHRHPLHTWVSVHLLSSPERGKVTGLTVPGHPPRASQLSLLPQLRSKDLPAQQIHPWTTTTSTAENLPDPRNLPWEKRRKRCCAWRCTQEREYRSY